MKGCNKRYCSACKYLFWRNSYPEVQQDAAIFYKFLLVYLSYHLYLYLKITSTSCIPYTFIWNRVKLIQGSDANKKILPQLKIWDKTYLLAVLFSCISYGGSIIIQNKCMSFYQIVQFSAIVLYFSHFSAWSCGTLCQLNPFTLAPILPAPDDRWKA